MTVLLLLLLLLLLCCWRLLLLAKLKKVVDQGPKPMCFPFAYSRLPKLPVSIILSSLTPKYFSCNIVSVGQVDGLSRLPLLDAVGDVHPVLHANSIDNHILPHNGVFVK